jgi:hypothetical protein
MAGRRDEEGTARRDFLKLAGVAAVTGGGLLAAGAKPAAAQEEPQAEGSAGYRETEHVKTYYKLARF